MRPLPVPSLSHAILIGASRFADLEPLPAVHRNLDELATALSDPDTGILPRDRITVVADPESPGDVMRALRAAAGQAEAFFLVYYAGHGVRDPRRDERLFLAVRETEQGGPDGTAVAFDSVRDLIEDTMARTRVLILDCCYSGMAVGRMSGGAVDAREVAVRGTAVMTSSPPNSPSFAPPGDRYTAFTGELITLLRNGSRVPDEPLTVDVAYRSLQRALTARGLPAPQQRLTENASGILLSRAIRASAEPAPDPVPPPPPAPPRPAGPVPSEPVVPAVATARPSASPGWTARMLAKRAIWMTVWVALAIFAAGSAGGVAGVEVRPSGGRFVVEDRNSMILGIAVSFGCGIALGVRYLCVRRLGIPLPPASIPLVDRLPRDKGTAVLATVAVGFAVLAALALFDTDFATSPTQDGSPLSTNVTVSCLFGIVSLACCYHVYRRLRRGASSVVADDAPVGQH